MIRKINFSTNPTQLFERKTVSKEKKRVGSDSVIKEYRRKRKSGGRDDDELVNKYWLRKKKEERTMKEGIPTIGLER